MTIMYFVALMFIDSNEFNTVQNLTILTSIKTNIARRIELCTAILATTTVPTSFHKKGDDDIKDPRDMPPDTPTWGYLRYSEGDNQDIASQEAEVTKLVREEGWRLTKIFRDCGVSGKSTRNREGFELMTHLARQKPRPANLLIIWEFSRFARNQDHARFSISKGHCCCKLSCTRAETSPAVNCFFATSRLLLM
jgi:hypothetical protein